ncbi:hypothetical protein SAMN04488688_10160 [Paenibacillus sp. cl141a]|nr:hypothetical protein SAMN04488688_10160 [Paenibacillus sp. cl141a]
MLLLFLALFINIVANKILEACKYVNFTTTVKLRA